MVLILLKFWLPSMIWKNRRRFLNIKNTVHRLIKQGVMPIVNENDTVTTEEIRVGDNDRLAAKVAQMIGAEHLFILTCIDGVYDRDPSEEGAIFVESIEDVSSYMEAASGTSSLGTGGMLTKLQAANMAQNAGCTTIISRGTMERPVTGVLNGERKHTKCIAHSSPSSAWNIWLTDRLQMAGSLVIKQEVADALFGGDEGFSWSRCLSLFMATLNALMYCTFMMKKAKKSPVDCVTFRRMKQPLFLAVQMKLLKAYSVIPHRNV